MVGSPARISDDGPHVQNGSRAPNSTLIAIVIAPDASREEPQHEASMFRCPSQGPICRNSSCSEAADLIIPSLRNSVLRAVATTGTR